MARPAGWLSPRSTLTAAVALLSILSIAPPLLTSWAGAMQRPVTFLLAPVQLPVRNLVLTLTRSDDAPDWSDPEIAALVAQKDQLDLALRQANRLNEDLRQQIRELTLGMNLVPDFVPRLIGPVPVIGSGADAGGLYTIRAGTRQGVDVGGLAVLRGVHLVGRVQRAGDVTASVIAITDPALKQPVGGVVMLDDSTPGPACLLEPTGEGTLAGRLEDAADPNLPAPQIVPGLTVRLQDPQWPLAAHMLILGTVERVEPMPQQPLRRVITIRPEVRLDRAREVTIRTSAPRPASPAPAGAGSTGAPP